MTRAQVTWEAIEKEVSYLERQCELFTASLSSFLSAKTSLTAMNSCSASSIVPFQLEMEYFGRLSTSEGILRQMDKTVKTIENNLDALKKTTSPENLARHQVVRICEEISKLCSNQLSLCQNSLQIATTQQIISEEKSKSLLSLIIHRPFIWDLQKRIFPDMKSLLINKVI